MRSSATRRLLAPDVPPPTTPQITSPLVCIHQGQAVVFKVFLNLADRSKSNYPVYVREHLFNTNPTFDFSPFLELKRLVESTTYQVASLTHTFLNPGTYVFADAQNPQHLSVIVVQKDGSTCPRTPGPTIWPISADTLATFGIRSLEKVNVEINVAKIAGVFGFLLFVALLLLLAVYVWRPKEGHREPLYRWKPWHRLLGRPAVLKSSVAMRSSFVGEEGDGPMGPEKFTTSVFYDKLEDQNLHLNCQLSQEVHDMRRFFQKVHDQNEALKELVKIGSRMGAGGSASKPQDAEKEEAEEALRELAFLGFSPRLAQLMVSLKLLLDRYNTGKNPITKEIFEKSMAAEHAQKSGATALQNPLLSEQMKERLRLEGHLSGEESKELQAFADQTEEERQRIVAEERARLVKELEGVSPEDAARLIAEFEERLAERLAGLNLARANQKEAVRERLARLRRAKEARLRAQHQAQCEEAKLPVAFEREPSEAVIQDQLVMAEGRAEAVTDAEASEKAMNDAALSSQEMEQIGEHFVAEVDALKAVVSDEEAERLLRELLGAEERLDDDQVAAQKRLQALLEKRQAQRREQKRRELQEAQAAELAATSEPDVQARLREQHKTDAARLEEELGATDGHEQAVLDSDAEVKRLLEEVAAYEAQLRAQVGGNRGGEGGTDLPDA